MTKSRGRPAAGPMTLTSILHPTDFSDSAANALGAAAGLALRFGAGLRLVYTDTLHGGASSEDTAALEQYVERARALVAGGTQEAAVELTVTRQRAVSAFDGIMRAATDHTPDLIVMGTHGRTGISKLLMGSTAEKVLRHASCNVMTVRADARVAHGAAFRKILVPVDFSDGAGKALAVARDLRTDDTVLCLLHVVEPVPPMYYAGDVTSRFELDGELRARIDTTLRDWSGDLQQAQPMIAEGNAAVETARVAHDIEADLVVISTRGLTGIDRLLVGSVTQRVCQIATVPVLAVR